jgi:hypothetical protein
VGQSHPPRCGALKREVATPLLRKQIVCQQLREQRDLSDLCASVKQVFLLPVALLSRPAHPQQAVQVVDEKRDKGRIIRCIIYRSYLLAMLGDNHQRLDKLEQLFYNWS